MPSLLITLGLADPGAALRRVLTAFGSEVAPGPPNAGALLDAQLAGAVPTDAYMWAPISGGSATRLLPGRNGGLEPAFPRALSSAAGGLVLAMEATRTRDRYLLGAFLAGRTVELHRCVEGVASSERAHELCDEDAIVDAFAAWLTRILGPAVEPPHLLGTEPTDALLATHSGAPDDEPELPVLRLALLERDAIVSVVERAGELDTAALEGVGTPAAAIGLGGAGAPARWALAGPDGAHEEGVAVGLASLADALPTWALAAPT